MIQVQYGDVWACGPHRIVCGNSQHWWPLKRLQQVMAYQPVLILTDPPYGKIRAAWDQPTLDFVAYLKYIACPSATAAIFNTLPYGFDLHAQMIRYGWQWRNDYIWTKANGGPKVSPKLPRSAHEHIFVYCQGGISPSDLIFNGYESGANGQVWGDNHHQPRNAAAKQVYGLDDGERQGRRDGKRWIRTLLQGRVKQALPVAERTTHPTQKPGELMHALIQVYTQPGQAVVDLFLGSGTTLLACEQTQRICYAMDYNPLYIQMALERYYDITLDMPRLLQRDNAAVA